MGALGDTLRQARLDKRATLDEAAEATRIRRSYLEALEEEDVAALPALVYVRGFIRTYADFLGLNPQVLVDMYEPKQRREPTTPALRAALPRMPIPRQIPVRLVLWVVGTIVAVALVVFLWNIYQTLQSATLESDLGRSVRPGTPTPLVRLPTLPPLAIASPSPSPSPTAEPTPVPTAEVTGLLVEIVTSAPVYVEAAVDGHAALAETLPAGVRRELPRADGQVILRVSNPSALTVSVNHVEQKLGGGTQPMEYSWQR